MRFACVCICSTQPAAKKKPRPKRRGFVIYDRRNRPLELPLQAGGNAHYRCGRPAVRIGGEAARRGSGVMAIGGDRPSAGAEIVMGVGPVKGRRHVGVPDQILRVLVLIRCGDHVRLVLGLLAAAHCGVSRSISKTAGKITAIRDLKIGQH